MRTAIHQSYYLSEAVRQVEGGLRLRLVEGQLRSLEHQGRLPDEVADLLDRIEKAIQLWCEPCWMPGVPEVIDYFLQNWKSGVPALVDYFTNELQPNEARDIVEFANVFLESKDRAGTELSTLGRLPQQGAKPVAAVGWLHQAQALELWTELSQNLGTLAVRRDLCEGLKQLKLAVEGYNNTVRDQISKENRLPFVLRSQRVLKILGNISKVADGIRQSLSNIEVKVLNGKSSSAFKVGENSLAMNAFLQDANWPALVMFELIKDQDESFLELLGDSQQLIQFCYEVDSTLRSEVQPTGDPVRSAELSDRLTLIGALLRRLDVVTAGLSMDAPRRVKLATDIGNLAGTLLCQHATEVKLLYEPDLTQSSPWPFKIDDADFNQPASVLCTGLMLVQNGEDHLIVQPKVRVPIRLHSLYAVLDEAASLVRDIRPGATSCKLFAEGIKNHKLRGDAKNTLDEQAATLGWRTFKDDLVSLVRELELIQGRSLPDQLKKLVDEAFRILKTEGYVTERSLVSKADGVPWEFQVLGCATEDELPMGRIIQRRLVGIDDAVLDDTMALQVAPAAGGRPLAKFLNHYEQEFRALQLDDHAWMSQHLHGFIHDVKAALHGDKNAEVKAAVDFFSLLFERCKGATLKVRYRTLCSGLLKTIQNEIGYTLSPAVEPDSLELENISSKMKDQLDVNWEHGAGDFGQVLKVSQFSSPFEKGSVTASLGEKFPELLRELIALQKAGAEFKVPSVLADFQLWLQDLTRFYWDPQSFVAQWNGFKQQVLDLVKASQPSSYNWLDEWVRLAQAAEPNSGTRYIFTVAYHDEQWFEVYPAIDTQTWSLYWPEDASTGYRGVCVIPGATARQVMKVDVFGLMAVRAKTVLYGGEERQDLLTACHELQEILKELTGVYGDSIHSLGVPIVTLLAAARDPIVVPQVPSKSTHHACIDDVLGNLIGAMQEQRIDVDRADAVLKSTLSIATQLGYADQTWNWSFKTSTIDADKLTTLTLDYEFSDQPIGRTQLYDFVVSDSPKQITVILTHSAGPSPTGYVQLLQLLESLDGQAPHFSEALKQSLIELPSEVALHEVVLKEQRVAEIWDLVTVELTAELGNRPEAIATASRFLEAALQLADAFGIEAFGTAGTYMSSIATNRNYEVWFEFDHAELSRRAGNMEGAIDRIKKIIRPGLRRRNAPTPLRRAIVGL